MLRTSLVSVFISLLALSGPAATRLPLGLSSQRTVSGPGAVMTLPPLDVGRLMAEDAAAGPSVPYRIGSPRDVDLDLSAASGRITLAGGERLWLLKLGTPGALWQSFVFSSFELPMGVSLYIYAPGGGEVLGPYTSADNLSFRTLATPVLAGDEALIEVDFAPGTSDVIPLRLRTAVAGYRRFAVTEKRAGSCEVDINCPDGADWQNDKRAVALIYFDGWECTGTLLNNARRDCANYFLTAHHCIDRASYAEDTVFYWNYELTGCASGDVVDQTQSGATLRATYETSDFSLMELAAPPRAPAHVYYAGWSASADPAHGAVGIHHPDGDVKKISIENNPLVSDGADFWRVPNWDVGVTEPGSSGSGLWNMDHQVIGQLLGGASACGNPKSQMWDDYGKLVASWTGGGSAEERLQDWLDPDHTGAVTLNGQDASFCMASPHIRPVERP